MKIGILGGGQLGRMLALAGIPHGHQFRFWEPADNCPASDTGEVIKGSFEDLSLIPSFIAGLDCITYEFENIPSTLIAELSKYLAIYPAQTALEVSQDRLNEKNAFQTLGINCAPFAAINSLEDLERCPLSFPAILKTRRLGYDGKGQVKIESHSQLRAAWESIGEVPAILEGLVNFEFEASLLAARARNGAQTFYPLIENRHKNGILSSSRVPSPHLNPSLQSEAESIGAKLLSHLDYVGLLTVEFFVVSGRLVANEIAPRVHNSGHWSIEGAETSQFENHIRAVSGAPLGSTALRGNSIMLNLVGEVPASEPILDIPHTHLHLYRKSGRARRKIGHITINHSRPDELAASERKIQTVIEPFLKF